MHNARDADNDGVPGRLQKTLNLFMLSWWGVMPQLANAGDEAALPCNLSL